MTSAARIATIDQTWVLGHERELRMRSSLALLLYGLLYNFFYRFDALFDCRKH